MTLRSNDANSMSKRPVQKRVPTSMSVSMLKKMCERVFKLPAHKQKLFYTHSTVRISSLALSLSLTSHLTLPPSPPPPPHCFRNVPSPKASMMICMICLSLEFVMEARSLWKKTSTISLLNVHYQLLCVICRLCMVCVFVYVCNR